MGHRPEHPAPLGKDEATVEVRPILEAAEPVVTRTPRTQLDWLLGFSDPRAGLESALARVPEPQAAFQVNASELRAKFPKLASRRSEVQRTQAGDRDGIEHSAGDIGS